MLQEGDCEWPIAPTIAEVFHLVRRRRAIIQGDLARWLGIPRGQLCRYENGRLPIDPVLAARWASALRIQVSAWLSHRHSGEP